MTFADLKSSVLLTLLCVFGVGWIALYWIMADQVTAAEATALEMHGQQETTISALSQRLDTINETLGRIDERTTHHSKVLERLESNMSTILLKLQQTSPNK